MRGQETAREGPIPKVPGKVAVVASAFHRPLVEALVRGAQAAIAQAGAELLGPFWAPGALELPLLCQWVIEETRPVAVVALGCVIQGETRHFQLVADNAVRGLLEVSLAQDVPVGQGVLACQTVDQAHERAADGPANSGFGAALAALEMAALRRRLTSGSDPA